jgi:hypothetical protein
LQVIMPARVASAISGGWTAKSMASPSTLELPPRRTCTMA